MPTWTTHVHDTPLPTYTPVPTSTATHTPTPTATNTLTPPDLTGRVAVATDEIAEESAATWQISLDNIGETVAENIRLETELPVGTILAPESEALGWQCPEVVAAVAAGTSAVTSCLLDLGTLEPNTGIETFLYLMPSGISPANPEIREPAIVVTSDTNPNGINISTGIGNNVSVILNTPMPTSTVVELPSPTWTIAPIDTPTDAPTDTPTDVPTDTPTDTATPVPTSTSTVADPSNDLIVGTPTLTPTLMASSSKGIKIGCALMPWPMRAIGLRFNHPTIPEPM